MILDIVIIIVGSMCGQNYPPDFVIDGSWLLDGPSSVFALLSETDRR